MNMEMIWSGDEDLAAQCLACAQLSREISNRLGQYTRGQKDSWLLHAASLLEKNAEKILQANQLDLEAGPGYGLSEANIDRLRLTPLRLRQAVEGLRQIAALPDPVGEIREGSKRPNGLQVLKQSVPLGVILFLYESRPNVTIDAAGLCFKSGNAVILRGGKEAWHSNQAIFQILQQALIDCQIPAGAIQMVGTTHRDAVGHLLQLNKWIDLVIPRGGESLIERVAREARMPVLKHYRGNCHIYVDAPIDQDIAEKIIINSKCQRPGVCNALESLLIHKDHVKTFLPRLGQALSVKGVEIRGCAITCLHLPGAKMATEDDFAAEYLELIVSIRVVNDLQEAIDHINHYGSQHTDAIITKELENANRFIQGVDSAAVVVNASTRFHDGYELGLGAEIGISTDKFHARGPCGLRELTTYKYVVFGNGQIRE